MTSKEELEESYKLRGLATDKEREVEDRIFEPTAQHTEAEIEQLLAEYRAAKEVRADASIAAARAYMSASPEARKTAEWHKYTPGHDDDIGRGYTVVPLRKDKYGINWDLVTAFRDGLEKLTLEMAVFQSEDKAKIRVVIPAGAYWVIINPHASLDYFCQYTESCDVSVKCCKRLHANERAEQLVQRNQWSTNQEIKVTSRARKLQLFCDIAEACEDAFEALHDIAF